jgi:hypothetical protein
MFVRLCGLSEIIPTLAEHTSYESISSLLTEIAEIKSDKVNANMKPPFVISHR